VREEAIDVIRAKADPGTLQPEEREIVSAFEVPAPPDGDQLPK